MHILGSNNSWSYSQGFNHMIDFCVWSLQRDGLRVPPFDQHADGDGTLRAIGLDEVSWRTWFERVVSLQYQQQQAHTQHSEALRNREISLRDVLIPEAHNPALAWQGVPAVRQRLVELWDGAYRGVFNERNRDESRLTNKWAQAESLRPTRLWDELQVHKKRIPVLLIHLIAYEQASIDYLVPPVSLIMTIKAGQPDGEAFCAHVLAAAAELAAKSDTKHPHTSGYTLVPQTSHRYIVHAWKPEVAAPPVVRVATKNEQQEKILQQLERGHGPRLEIDLSTIKFLRGKTRGNWHIEQFTFEDTAGRTHHYRQCLQQRADGAWMVREGGGEDEMLRPVAVHDHPTIVVSWAGPSWSTQPDGHRQQIDEFHATGEIKDNGFEVTRARLVDKQGRVLEDTVDDGLVFFVAADAFEMPIQVELYNRTGALVWRQPILEAPNVLDILKHWQRFKRKK